MSEAVSECLKSVVLETGKLPEAIKLGLDWIEPLPDRLTLWECAVQQGVQPVGEQRIVMVRGSAWASTLRGRPPTLRIERSAAPKLSYWNGKEFRRSRTASEEATAAGSSGIEAMRQKVLDCLPLTVQPGEQQTLFVASFESSPKFTQSLRQQGAPVYGLNPGWQETSRRWMDDDERLEASAELAQRRFRDRTPIASLFCNWTMETSALLTSDCPSDHPVLRAWGQVTTARNGAACGWGVRVAHVHAPSMQRGREWQRNLPHSMRRVVTRVLRLASPHMDLRVRSHPHFSSSGARRSRYD